MKIIYYVVYDSSKKYFCKTISEEQAIKICEEINGTYAWLE